MSLYENTIKIVLIVLAIVIISVLLIKRFLYFQPSTDFLPYKETYKDISEGNLHGWLIQGGQKIVIVCHGNTGNISHRQYIIDSLEKLGYSVLIFDYSGYGRSRGIPSEKQFYQDASVFVNMMLKQTDKSNIILYGESIGAPVAAFIARKYGIQTLIIDSGLPSIKKYIEKRYSILGMLGFIFYEFNTESYLNGYTGRVLIIHSLTDEIIPYEITDVMRKHATESLIISGSHNNRIIPWNKINLFIRGDTL